MSLKTWMNEFYPVSADALTTPAGAIEHCIRKWEGLRPENLERHGMVKTIDSKYDIIEKGRKLNDVDLIYLDAEEAVEYGAFKVNADTCALCRLHGNGCESCELANSRDGLDCYSDNDEERQTPFDEWGQKHDPEPMIFWLVKARVDNAPGV